MDNNGSSRVFIGQCKCSKQMGGFDWKKKLPSTLGKFCEGSVVVLPAVFAPRIT